jgi:putative component of toxin-antitoxin plasmid stabilization module
MERSAWTDARLDDRFDHIDRRFDQVDRRFDRLENEMREGFAGVRAEIHELRVEFGSLRNMMFRSYVALAVALIAAVVARGV